MTTSPGTPMNGGQALIKSLEMEGVEVMFGLPGGAILPVYDPLIDSSIRHILVRHEQGAGPLVTMATPGRPVACAYPSAMCPAPCSWRTRLWRIGESMRGS